MPNKQPEICLTIANHWSYIGIGWQQGVESCAQSINDSLELARRQPSLKTCINLDAFGYQMVARHFPEVIDNLRKGIQAGLVEIIGGTYSQPLGSMISGESNLRQILMGREIVASVLGIELETFLEQEEFSHPQLPQILLKTGYRYCSQSQCDTWGRHGNPKFKENVFLWEGPDGSVVPTTAHNDLVLHPPMVTDDVEWLESDAGRKVLSKLGEQGVPLVTVWTEFGWEPLDSHRINRFDFRKYVELAKQFDVQFVTHKEFMRSFAPSQPTTKRIHADDYARLLPWGIGGDQIRRVGRETEGLLITAEKLGFMVCSAGIKPEKLECIHEAWQHLLTSQSHDVALCEYSRSQGAPPPLDPVVPAHFQTWGSYGYQHLAQAVELTESFIDINLPKLAKEINTASDQSVDAALIVVNPRQSQLNGLFSTGRLNLQELRARNIAISGSDGRPRPVQILSSGLDADGKLSWAELLIDSQGDVPAFGVGTLYLRAVDAPCSAVETDLEVDAEKWIVRNENVEVQIDPMHGGILRMTDRQTGLCLVDGSDRAFPTIVSRPDSESSTRIYNGREFPVFQSSLEAPTELEWVQTGPLKATVRSRTQLPELLVETEISLGSGSPAVDVRIRLCASIPPVGAKGTIRGWMLPLEIEDGYWADMRLGFEPEQILRDYPFGAEPCCQNAIHALTWINFVAPKGGLLLVHNGNQYFERVGSCGVQNLIMREWESHFTGGEAGWPRVSTSRYRLVTYNGALSMAECHRQVREFDEPVICHIEPLHQGRVPAYSSFLSIDNPNVMLSAAKPNGDQLAHIRILNYSDSQQNTKIHLGNSRFDVSRADAHGRSKESIGQNKEDHSMSLRPWQIEDIALEPCDEV